MTARAASIPRAGRPALDRLLATRIAINWEVALYIAIFALAFALRFWDLGARALHHDESIHAQWSWNLAEGDYRHSPVFHGPLYYHAQALVFLLFGASDYTARVSAAIFGMVLAALPLLLRRRLGGVGTMAAVAFIAFSPTLVYYSRFIREDIYMSVFTLLMVVSMWRYLAEGRDRWLIAFALALAGSYTTKEATYLTVAILLLFLNGHLAAALASATMRDRGFESRSRHLVLTAGLFPYAWAIAALWPFLGGIRRNAGWGEMPRPGDVLVLLGTLTLPVLTPVAKPVMERIGLAEAGQLDWPGVCDAVGSTGRENALVLAGLFSFVVGAAAFVGLQWRPKTWAIAAGGAAILYLTLMTTIWTNFNGLCSGPWGSLDYWLSQQSVARGNQPWFYYYMLMPAYEFLPLVMAVGGAWWAVVRGSAFSRFLVFWIVGTWLSLSWAGEKMPWLNVHIALPVALLAAWTVQRAWQSWRRDQIVRVEAVTVAMVAAVSAGGIALAVLLPGEGAILVVRLLFALALPASVALGVRTLGKAAIPLLLVTAVIGGLAFFSLRTMVMVVYERGDVPKDLLIYTQSSPEIPRIATDIDRLAAATGKGFDMPIAVDSSDSMAWPWAWYLRDYRNVRYQDFDGGVPEGDWDVILVNEGNAQAFTDFLASQPSPKFGAPEKYPHRWWYDERYKFALDSGPLDPWVTIGHGLHLGPPEWDTVSRIKDGILDDGWLGTWYRYWRDHDAVGVGPWPKCTGCGAINAFAYFPANFDRETGMISVEPIQPPEPTVDAAGRPVFGGVGVQPGQFFAPVDIESDAEGNLYVIDRATRKLQKFDSAGNFLAVIDVRANPEGDMAESEPWGLAVAPDGSVIVADTFGWRVRIFDAGLTAATATFGQPPSQDPPGDYDLFGPRDAVVTGAGEIWVTDTGHDRVMVYSLDGTYIRTVGGSGSGPGEFDEPVGLAIDAAGNVYVADMYNGRVEVFDGGGTYLREFRVEGWGGTDVNDKPYLEVLSDGRIAVSLPLVNQVAIYSSDGTLLSTIFDADDPVNRPYGMVETADGKLWIVEGGNGRVRLFDIP